MTDHRSGNLGRPAAKLVRDWLPFTSARDLQMDTDALSAGFDRGSCDSRRIGNLFPYLTADHAQITQ
jgi:hypothetical protein